MMAKIREDGRPMGSPKSWAASYGTHLAGQAAIDGADHAAITMENKWGAGRLRLLVSVRTREKVRQAKVPLQSAIWHGDLAELQAGGTEDDQRLDGARSRSEAAGASNPEARGMGGHFARRHRSGHCA